MSQAPSKCLSKWIKVVKWDYLKNPSLEFKKIFLFRDLMNPKKDWKAKLERYFFLNSAIVQLFNKKRSMSVGFKTILP